MLYLILCIDDAFNFDKDKTSMSNHKNVKSKQKYSRNYVQKIGYKMYKNVLYNS